MMGRLLWVGWAALVLAIPTQGQMYEIKFKKYGDAGKKVVVERKVDKWPGTNSAKELETGKTIQDQEFEVYSETILLAGNLRPQKYLRTDS